MRTSGATTIATGTVTRNGAGSATAGREHKRPVRGRLFGLSAFAGVLAAAALPAHTQAQAGRGDGCDGHPPNRGQNSTPDCSS